MSDWFTRTFGFTEQSPDQVRRQITLEGQTLVSRVNGARVGCGRLSTPCLAELRHATAPDDGHLPPSTLTEQIGDAGALHRDPHHAGHVFQAASQFNLLEMVAPDVTPEAGVGRYGADPTQGPACAVACGGGTVYRNYFVPLEGGQGQTAHRQINTLADLAEALAPDQVTVQNGYAFASSSTLSQIGARLPSIPPEEMRRLEGLLRIGVHHDVQVLGTSHTVTQVYASALPVAYSHVEAALWEPFARLVLRAAYEATLRAARLDGRSHVHLTLLGGGVFGNPMPWIADAVVAAVKAVPGLDVTLVSYGRSQPGVRHMVQRVTE